MIIRAVLFEGLSMFDCPAESSQAHPRKVAAIRKIARHTTYIRQGLLGRVEGKLLPPMAGALGVHDNVHDSMR